MADDIEPFDFNGNSVRVLVIDGDPWWVALDVCSALGIVNAHQAVARLDGEDRCSAEVLSPQGTVQSTNIINESGLYELIIRSDKPEARVFRRWITSEVLPQIRKTGRYEATELRNPALQRIVDLTYEIQRTQDEQERLAHEQERQGGEIRELAEDVLNLKQVSALTGPTDLLTLREAAHALGTGQMRLARWLRAEGIMFVDHDRHNRLKQHPWMENDWARESYERAKSGDRRFCWVPRFTPAGVVQLKRRWELK